MQDPLNVILIEEEKQEMGSYFQRVKIEEDCLRLKSRAIWLKNRDKKNKYFQTMQKVRNSTKAITAIDNKNRDWIFEQTKIVKEFKNHFSQVFNGDHSIQVVEHIYLKESLNLPHWIG